MKQVNKIHPPHNGFTLLEILLTTAILLVGLTAIFQTSRSALRSMSASRDLTDAQNACQATLNELLAQSAPIRTNEGKTIDNLPNWKIRIDLYPAPQPRLYVLHLSAQQFSPEDGTLLGIKYQLIRWIPLERVWVAPAETSEAFASDEFGELPPPR
jgi:prepilin-type N-terminal cleavage/methylation domain-containing protein